MAFLSHRRKAWQVVSGGGGVDTEFITSVNAGTKSAIDGFFGMKITVGGSAITVTEVGIYGNATHYHGTFDVYVRSLTGTDLGHATVTWGTAAQFYYATLSSPITLNASTSYYIMTDDLNSDDVYISANTTVTPTAVATVDDAAFGQPPADEGTGSNHSYGPLSFKYH